MTEPQTNPILVTISPDRLEARLGLRAQLHEQERGLETVRATVVASGVSREALDEDALRSAVEGYDEEEGVSDVVIARGTPPTPAGVGLYTLDPEMRERLDVASGKAPPAIPADDDDPDAPTKPLSHYERSTFVVVQPGDRLGEFTPPDPGQPGVGVTGEPIPPPRPAIPSYEPSERVEVDDDNAIHARVGGRLEAVEHVLDVIEHLVIEGGVDFSTGNIDFPGDVSTAMDVKDRFEVRVGGCFEVHGVVEAADVRVGRDATLWRGMVGRGRGSLRVDGDLAAKYLDDASVSVGGDLRVSREITNCRLSVRGRLIAPGASLIGGDTALACPASLAHIGAPNSSDTRLYLGTRRDIERMLGETMELLRTVETARDQAEQLHETLKGIGGRPGSAESKQTDEAWSRYTEATYKRERLLDALARLITTHDEATSILLEVSGVLHGGVTLVAGACSAQIRSDLEGPLEIHRDDEVGLLLVDVESGARAPIERVARVEEISFKDVVELARARLLTARGRSQPRAA